jgi:hypothetical protein
MTIKTSYEFVLVDCTTTIDDQVDRLHHSPLVDSRDFLYHRNGLVQEDDDSSFCSDYSDDSSLHDEEDSSSYNGIAVDREELSALLSAYEGLFADGVTANEFLESVLSRWDRMAFRDHNNNDSSHYRNDSADSLLASSSSSSAARFLSRRSRIEGNEGPFLRRLAASVEDTDDDSSFDVFSSDDEEDCMEGDLNVLSDDDNDEDDDDDLSVWSDSVEEYTIPLRTDEDDRSLLSSRNNVMTSRRRTTTKRLWSRRRRHNNPGDSTASVLY